jgi:hypothetical protein
MLAPGSIVDADDLIEVALASAVAGVGVTIAFSVAIWGAARFADARRGAASVVSGVAAAVSVAALLAFAAAIVAGLVIMVSERS